MFFRLLVPRLICICLSCVQCIFCLYKLSGPYSQAGSKSRLSFWYGFASDQDPRKAAATNFENADRTFSSERVIGVFDGVSSVNPPWSPADMSSQMAIRSENELLARFAGGNSAQNYDKELKRELGDQVLETGDWLRNLCTQAFLKTSVGGSTTMALAVLTVDRLTYLALGDCQIFVFRFNKVLGNAKILFTSKIGNWQRTRPDGVTETVPFQTYLDNLSELTVDYAKGIFADASFGVLAQPLQQLS